MRIVPLAATSVLARSGRRIAAMTGVATIVAVGALTVTPGPAARADGTFDADLVALVNQDRVQNGVPALQVNVTLGSIAESGAYRGCGYTVDGRAEDLLQRSYFSHTILDCGSQNVFAMMQADGLSYGAAGENIGWSSGLTDPAAAAAYLNTQFMNSPEHRANILNPAFTHVAVGSAQTAPGATWSGAGGAYGNVWIATEEFASLPAGGGGAAPSEQSGYWMAAADGSVYAFGNAGFFGSAGHLAAPVVSMARTPSRNGYWLLGSDGGVFTFGDASFHGSTGALRLNAPVVSMSPTPSGNGYWMVATDGGIFSFGDATFHGSTGAMRLNRPIVGMASTPSGRGYWLVASDGGIFAFGDAAFHGSTGAMPLNRPIVGMASTPSGNGYWLVASDGGIFAFGDAAFHGSTGAMRLNRPITAMASSPSGAGYWLIASDGGVFSFGDAPFSGSVGAGALASAVVAAGAH